MVLYNINFDHLLSLFGTFALFFNSIFSIIYFISQSKSFVFFGKYASYMSSFCIGLSLLYRWFNAGYFPLSNLYESLLFLSWCLLNAYLILEQKTKSSLLNFLVIPIIFLITAFATLILPSDMQKASPLVPALQSNWLMMHVSMMMLSYSILILGSLISIFYLFLSLKKSANKKELLLNNLDLWSYRTIGFGFPTLTIGIISGAVWANDAWGSYWSWDPKETWALITWLIFASYLHARIIRGWKGEKAAFLASLGFMVVWVCYLGVNFLGKGLHSYGWILDK